MSQKCCPRFQKCVIFDGVLKDVAYAVNFKTIYCFDGSEGFNSCRRYQLYNLTGKCPDNLLPNSLKSIDEIKEDMKVHGLI
ncbi:MAG: hypothetical protein MI922_15990 [Bacteroidales bacterium]|nr:hypothetical protein [Bacteroidales bacterium]